MMVKIAIPVEGEFYFDQRSWVLYDNIQRVHLPKQGTYNYNISTKDTTFDCGTLCDVYGDYDHYISMPIVMESRALNSDKPYANDQVIPYVALFCTMKDGTVKTLIFDTLAYITNDDGKTVEKITVNA